jgi:hypothetical protein
MKNVLSRSYHYVEHEGSEESFRFGGIEDGCEYQHDPISTLPLYRE